MKQITDQKLNNLKNGFTLLEILLVLSLLAGIFAIFGGRVFTGFGKGKAYQSKIQIEQFGQALTMYQLDCGRYPTTEQGLEALVSKPTSSPDCKNYNPTGYLNDKKTVPADAWGNPFKYSSDKANSYEIKSLGADGAEGGEGNDKDLTSNDG